MTPTRAIRIFAAAFALALAPTGSLAQQGDAPERKPWNAEEVLPLAKDLQKTINQLRLSWLKEPARHDPLQAKQRVARQMDDAMKGLQSSTKQLVKRIQSGGGYDETLNIARKIGRLLNDAEQYGRKLDIGAWTTEKVGPAMKAINALAPYYGSKPLYDVEQQKKIN